MSDAIEWAEPPAVSRGRAVGHGYTQAFVAALKAHPGEWARYPRSVAGPVASGQYAKQHPGTEWTGRKREDGRRDLYARWVGEQ